MNGITHKQARKWIDRRQDGQLKENQQSLLEEHLRSCDSCRTYSDEMELLASRLTNEFQIRWEGDPGPSKNVMNQVMTNVRSISVAKRTSLHFQVLTGVIVLVVLAFTMNFVISKLQSTSTLSNAGTPTSAVPANLGIDPQSCKSPESNSVPSQLYGYDVIQNTAFTDGNFTYDFWLYCDPNLKPEDPEHYSAIAGLGIYSSWRYTGPQVEGPVRYHYAFEPDQPFGESGSDGPLYQASAKGKLGISLSESKIREYIQQGLPVQFRVVVDSSLGQDAAVLSFALEPTQNGVRIVDAHAGPLNSASTPLLAFASNESGFSDIYTVHADGSGLTNLTNNTAGDNNPFWSPDGRQILFESDRTGYQQIFTMDIDGSNVRQLTKDGTQYKLPYNLDGKTNPWSPDGSRILVLQSETGGEEWTLESLDRNGKNPVWLGAGQFTYSGISWSPNGNYIWYATNPTAVQDGIDPDVYIVDANGKNTRELNTFLPKNEVSTLNYQWSSDGRSVVFTTSKSGSIHETVYEFQPGTNTLLEKNTLDADILDWKDGIYLTTDIEKDLSFAWQRPDGTTNRLSLDTMCREFNFKRSNRGNYAIGTYCPYGEFRFYWANTDGSITKQLLTPPVNTLVGGVGGISWSSDDQYIAFTIISSDQANMYLFNAEEALKDPLVQPVELLVGKDGIYPIPSWQPLATRPLVKEEPTPRPAETTSAGGLIAFTSVDENGNTDIYTVHADGSGLVNLTKNAAKESSLVWSPDGRRLAFSSDQVGNWDIFSMNADGSDLIRLTEDTADEAPSLWSPNGKRIAYTLFESDGKTANIYVMDANGENKRRLTDRHPKPDAIGVSAELWSLDGQFIFYTDQDQLNKVNIESGEITWLPVRGHSILTLRNDSKLLYFSDCSASAGVFCFVPITFDEDGTGKETYQTIKLKEVCTTLDDPRARMMNFYYLAKWSPDRTKIMFHFNCGVGGQTFYIANADGSGFRPLISDFLPTGYPGLNNDIHFDWSSDSQSIIFTSSPDGPHTQDLFTLNIGNALQNLEIQPTSLHLSTSQVSELAWQSAP